MMYRLLVITLLFVTIGADSSAARGDVTDSGGEVISSALRARAVAILRETLQRESRWVKVHAGEHLVALGYPQGVSAAFEAERAAHEHVPQYRIGIWRVLAQTASSAGERRAWVDRIRAVVIDPAATDRVHALESLAKLGDRAEDASLEAAVVEAGRADPNAVPYARWLLAGSGGSAERAQLAELLDAVDPSSRLVAAYAIQRLRPQDAAIRRRLAEAAQREPLGSVARVSLLSAAWILAEGDRAAESFRASLLDAGEHGSTSDRTEVCAALAERGTKTDVPALQIWLDDPESDVRAAAAAALLRIGRRGSHRLGWLDWSVIGGYMLGMLGIGWFYSSRTKTTEDYLLGGRTMKPWTVGLSLFATLCSTISYLSTPGEMIEHGPMYFTSIAALPVATVVVGWWLIPCFMRLPVTSAYEILETRLGLGVRLLGATFFLTLRLLWMAVILEITTSVVLLPLLGLGPSAAMYLCALLGLTTVVYSSMGGIRAVVMTDVVQTFILLGGAVAAMIFITWQLGGIGGWWPTAWDSNWDPITLGYDLHARMSLVGVFVATFFWHVCTAGSDQMAIQRYLATRDVRSARRMFSISMIMGVVVTVLLAALGMALLAWFREHSEMLGDGQSIAHNADQLFPRFIVAGLPEGVGGLVIAGLLAAAMSSLSAGLNSSCAVITVDFFDRFARREAVASERVRRARYVSWSVGLAVVLLSALVGAVQGNILEVAFKVVNLLVAPLFGLFFMALFVRWATSFGTFVGAAFGVATVVAISYWPEITGRQEISFLWAMPLGLLVQISVGAVASLAPIGSSKPLIGQMEMVRRTRVTP